MHLTALHQFLWIGLFTAANIYRCVSVKVSAACSDVKVLLLRCLLLSSTSPLVLFVSWHLYFTYLTWISLVVSLLLTLFCWQLGVKYFYSLCSLYCIIWRQETGSWKKGLKNVLHYKHTCDLLLWATRTRHCHIFTLVDFSLLPPHFILPPFCFLFPALWLNPVCGLTVILAVWVTGLLVWYLKGRKTVQCLFT